MCWGAGGTISFILIFLHFGSRNVADSRSQPFQRFLLLQKFWSPLEGASAGLRLELKGVEWAQQNKKKPKKSRSRGKLELGLVLSLAWKILQDPHPAATRELPGSMAFSISSRVFHSQLPALELPSHGLFPNKPLRALCRIYPSWFPHPTGYGVGVRDYCLFLPLSQKAAASPRKIHLLVPRCAEWFHFI